MQCNTSAATMTQWKSWKKKYNSHVQEGSWQNAGLLMLLLSGQVVSAVFICKCHDYHEIGPLFPSEDKIFTHLVAGSEITCHK